MKAETIARYKEKIAVSNDTAIDELYNEARADEVKEREGAVDAKKYSEDEMVAGREAAVKEYIANDKTVLTQEDAEAMVATATAAMASELEATKKALSETNADELQEMVADKIAALQASNDAAMKALVDDLRARTPAAGDIKPPPVENPGIV